MSVLSPLSDSRVDVGEGTSKSMPETKTDARPPEMKSMLVVSNVRNRYARTVVTSKYVNSDTRAQEATFSIILPDTAFIAGFVMEIKGNQYEAYVKEKLEAKEEYQKAVASGRAAAHVAVSARDSNNFFVSVNVEPQGDVTFILTYEELLARKHGKYEMVINLHPGQLTEELGVDVNINETKPIVYIETPELRSGNEITDKATKNKHAIISKGEDGVVRVSFHPTLEQQENMAKVLNAKEENKKSEQSPDKYKSNGISGQFIIEYDVERDPSGGEVLVNDGYFVHFFAPTDLKPIPKHVIFVLDVSGSMGGTKLKQLKEAMNNILNELNPDDYFNLVKFSTNISVLDSNYAWTEVKIPAESKLPESFIANIKNIKRVQGIVSRFKYEDCTNIHDALIVGLRLSSKGISHLKLTDNEHKSQPIIIFLTDGLPNVAECNSNNIIDMVEKRNDCDNKSAIFTLAFGDDADKEFLKELAIQNSGFLRNIYEAADASLQLQDFYKQISSPLLTKVNFKHSEGVKEVTKHKFDILFNGSEFVVAGKVDKMDDGFVLVEALTVDGTNEFSPCITIYPKQEEKEEYGSLERLWAYMTIKQLLDKKYEKKTSNEDASSTELNTSSTELNTSETKKQTSENTTEKEIAEKQALNLALKYSFVTPVTSLVVVKPDEPPTVGTLQDSRIDSLWDSEYQTNYGPIMMCSLSLDDSRNSKSALRYLSRRFSSRTERFSEIQEIFREKKEKISRFFVRSKNNIQATHIALESIKVDCNVTNRIAKTIEERKYVNFNGKGHDTTFTIELVDKTVLTEFEMKIKDNIYKAYGLDKKQAKKIYQKAVSNNFNAILVYLEDTNKITLSLYAGSNTDVTFIMKYEKCLEDNNDKSEIVINLQHEPFTEIMAVNIVLNETRPISNINIGSLRSQNGSTVMENKYATIDKSDDKNAQVHFLPTIEEQKEIVKTLGNQDEDFSGQFVMEYVLSPDLSDAQDKETYILPAIPFQYLVAIETK